MTLQAGQHTSSTKRPLKERLSFAFRTALPLSLFLSFMLCLFAPIDLYFSNPGDFWFTFGQLIGPMLLTAAVAFTGMMGAMCLFGLLVPKKVFGLTAACVFAASIAVYVQGTFFSSTIETINGNETIWNLKVPEMLLNTAVWLLILFVCLACYVMKNKTTLRVMRMICYALLGVQLLTCAVTCIGGISHQGNKSENYLSTDGLYDLSANENVVVFMMDTLDTRYFDSLLAEYPETLDGYDGFTFYHNMGSLYRKTGGFMSYFFTSEQYLNQMPLEVFCGEKIPASPMLNTLKDMDYDIRVYGDTSVNRAFTKDVVENLHEANITITSVKSFIKQWMILVSYRYAPTAMRPFFYRDFNYIFPALQRIEAKDGFAMATDDVTATLKSLNSHEMTLSEKNAFRFIPLFGAHRPYMTDAEGRPVVWGSVSRNEAVRASFKVVSIMIERMKALGIYDQSTIIILADHGEGELSSPAFLMKRANDHGELRISQAPVSQLDLTATILKAAGCDNYAEYGTPVDEWPEDAQRERFFYAYDYRSIKRFNMYFEPITEYVYNGDATDFDGYVPTGTVYAAN